MGITTLIFSKNRPMQLDLTLRTNKHYADGIRNEVVLYNCDQAYQTAYDTLKKTYPATKFIEEDFFRADVLRILERSSYVLFVVDDCIFTRKYSIETIKSYLDMCGGVIGFSLRLGKNTKFCYSMGIPNIMPTFQTLGKNIISFNWTEGGGDFGYPLELSSSLFRLSDLEKILYETPYFSPNSLEWSMYCSLGFMHKHFLLSYDTSVAFCNPINKVQSENRNRSGTNSQYSPENLLDRFYSGYRINSAPFDGFISNSCHQECDFEFIKC